MSMIKDIPLLSKEQAAQLADVTPRAVQNAIQKGQLDSVVIGRTHVLHRDDVRAWARSRRPPGNPSKLDVPMWGQGIGPGRLTVDHAASSYNQPVWVDNDTGQAYGPGDVVLSLIRQQSYSDSMVDRLKKWSDPERGPLAWRIEDQGRPLEF